MNRNQKWNNQTWFLGTIEKELNKSNFKDLLKTIIEMDTEEKEAFLEYSFNNWKQDNEQTDDVLVIGIKIWFFFFSYHKSLINFD